MKLLITEFGRAQEFRNDKGPRNEQQLEAIAASRTVEMR